MSFSHTEARPSRGKNGDNNNPLFDMRMFKYFDKDGTRKCSKEGLSYNRWNSTPHSREKFLIFLKAFGIINDIQSLSMTSVLNRYISSSIVDDFKASPAPGATPKDILNQEITKANNMAVALQRIWWRFTWNKYPLDEAISRATRLVLCQQMLDQFKYEANNPSSKLDSRAIDEIYQKILTNFDKQKDWFWWRGSFFNKEINNLKEELSKIKINCFSFRENKKNKLAITLSPLTRSLPLRFSHSPHPDRTPVGQWCVASSSSSQNPRRERETQSESQGCSSHELKPSGASHTPHTNRNSVSFFNSFFNSFFTSFFNNISSSPSNASSSSPPAHHSKK